MQTLCGQRPRFSLNLEETEPRAQQGRPRRMTARQRARKHHKVCSKICQFIYRGRQSLYRRRCNCPPKPWASFANTITRHPCVTPLTSFHLEQELLQQNFSWDGRRAKRDWSPKLHFSKQQHSVVLSSFFFYQFDFTQDFLRRPVSPQSRACCCPDCATRIPTCFGNRQLPAIISQLTNASWGFIAYIGYFVLHSPNARPAISG